MLVPMQGSQAKKEDSDGIFLLCSQACGNHLKDTLEKEVAMGTMFNTFRFTTQ